MLSLAVTAHTVPNAVPNICALASATVAVAAATTVALAAATVAAAASAAAASAASVAAAAFSATGLGLALALGLGLAASDGALARPARARPRLARRPTAIARARSRPACAPVRSSSH